MNNKLHTEEVDGERSTIPISTGSTAGGDGGAMGVLKSRRMVFAKRDMVAVGMYARWVCRVCK